VSKAAQSGDAGRDASAAGTADACAVTSAGRIAEPGHEQGADGADAGTRQPQAATATALALDPERMRESLGRLVLTLVAFVQRLLEMQAMRRMENGTLTDAEIERVGLALSRLADEIDWLKSQFPLADEDLNLDLGPLGRLL